ncbi:MAG: hypothetical protein AB7E95_11240 [Kiritimatiellales bacterium]
MSYMNIDLLKYVMSVCLITGCLVSSYAGMSETIDFSTYPDKVLTGHSDWAVSGSKTSRLEWQTKGGKVYTSTSEYAKAFYIPQMPAAGDTYSVELTFDMDIVKNISSRSADVMFLGLGNVENKHGDAVYVKIHRDGGTQWRLIYQVVQSGMSGTAGTFGKFFLKNIDPDKDGSVKNLILKLTLIRGETEKNWQLYGSLKNSVSDFSFEKGPVEFPSNKDFFSHPLMAFMGVNCGDEDGGVQGRTISRFQLTATP